MKLDILIFSRPDHLMRVYRQLLLQNDFSFLYVTFKVIPKWMSCFLRYKKIQYVSRNCLIIWWLTLVNILKFHTKWSWAQNLNELKISEFFARCILRKLDDCQIIHFAPRYCHKAVSVYLQKHANVFVLADMFMPNPIVALEVMKPIYKHYNMSIEDTYLYKYSMEIKSMYEHTESILVPSLYVKDTMVKTFPDKRYYVISYGITLSKEYVKKNVSKNKSIEDFVYAGAITIEKGCDVLLQWFKMHPKYNIHLYGRMNTKQQYIFSEYEHYSNILFHGTISKQQLLEEYKKYDVGIYLSRFDAYSLAVGEMVGSGLPVIVSESTGIKDDIKNFGFGLVTDLDNENISRAIQNLCDRENYEIYIENIDNYLNNQIKTYEEQVVELYRSILLHENLSVN